MNNPYLALSAATTSAFRRGYFSRTHRVQDFIEEKLSRTLALEEIAQELQNDWQGWQSRQER